jgi:crotonobetainyl-CoA:carnitine CoA-transferase CaiB-like acyl-CoA transferase
MFWSRVQDPFEVVNDPTLRAAGGIVDVPDGVATTPMIATPVDFHGTPWSPRGLAPGLGEHTAEILREVGLADAEIDRLAAAGAVALPAPPKR